MSRKSEPIDYMDLIARTAEEEHEEDCLAVFLLIG